MKKRGGIILTGLLGALLIPAHAEQAAEPLQRGEYIFNLGGCASCHTARDGEPLAGGVKMETKFGDFYTPNISPDTASGIGGWSDADFIRAMTQGLAPDGSHYYPSFPYTSYTNMQRQDLIDLKAYLDAQAPVRQANLAHELDFPFSFRPLLAFWKWLNFEPATGLKHPERGVAWNRGAYIVNGPGHCAECHSPRNLLGGLDQSRFLQGNPDGPEGEAVPGLTRHENNRISQWSAEDIVFSLQIGMIPDGDFLGGSMGHVIENTTSKLTAQDLEAIAAYLESVGQ